MSALPQSTRRKVSLLQLAQELNNVSKACQIMGYHRDTFYEVRRAFQVGGVQALLEEKRGPKGPIRTGCRPRSRRRSRPTQTFVLSEEQIELLERHSVDFRCRHVESSRPGELLNQDTFYWGTLKGVGKSYVQVVVDVFCSLAFAKVYTSKMPVTACELLYERVLPFYDELGVEIDAILTDNVLSPKSTSLFRAHAPVPSFGRFFEVVPCCGTRAVFHSLTSPTHHSDAAHAL